MYVTVLLHKITGDDLSYYQSKYFDWTWYINFKYFHLTMKTMIGNSQNVKKIK
jgi:hypothetical protein